MFKAVMLCFACGALLWAQVRPPLPIPGDPNTTGTPRNPDPIGAAGANIPGRSRESKKKKNKPKADQEPDFSVDGQTLSINPNKLVIHTNDGRWITFDLTPETKWTHGDATVDASVFQVRSTVHVEAFQDDQYFLTAASVDLLKDSPAPVTPAASPKAGTTAATSGGDDDDDQVLTQGKKVLVDPTEAPDRPVLRKRSIASGVRHDSPSSEPEAKQQTASSKPAPKDTVQDFSIDNNEPVLANHSGPGSEYLTSAENWIAHFSARFPNFYCNQITTRYTQQTRSEDWQAQDIVTARVIFVDGQVRYEDITVGGKKTSKSMMDIGGGTTSTGEYGTWLFGLFDPSTGTDFKYDHITHLNGNTIAVFHYIVPLNRSNWTIRIGGQELRPRYSGELWIDKATGQIWRLDSKADDVPKNFPEDTIETGIDYDMVPLGTNKYVLPTESENIGCVRGSMYCSKNDIEFRDYHKYGSESSITFGK